MSDNKKCLLCNKTMPIIGLGRKNGKKINNSTGRDWTNDPNTPRLYHKKCHKIVEDRAYWKKYYEDLAKEKALAHDSDDDYSTDEEINI